MTDGIQVEYVRDYQWLHSHGAAEKGLPELEAREIPGFAAPAVARLMHSIFDYMLRTGKVVKAGETMSSSGAVFMFAEPEPMPGSEEHYETERLQIVDVALPCSCCGVSIPPSLPPSSHENPTCPDNDEEPPPYRVEVECPDDPELGKRLEDLAEANGGESLGRYETFRKEEYEVEEFAFETQEAAEAFAQACQAEPSVESVSVGIPADE